MTNIKSFNITTAAEADTALEGVRARLVATQMFVDMALEEALEEIANLAPTNRPSTYVDSDHYCSIKDYDVEKFRRAVTDEGVRSNLIREFGRHTETKWVPKQEHVGTTNEDVANMWVAFLSHAADVNKAVRNQLVAASDYLAICNEYGNLVANSTELLGAYVDVSTGRRRATGWAVRGRGDTLYVLKDPWPVTIYEIRNRPGVEHDLPESILEPRHRWAAEQDIVRFTRSKANVVVILPRATAKRRKDLADTWWPLYQAASDAGEKAFASRNAWLGRGGRQAKNKKLAIDNETAAALRFDPVRSMYGRDEAWAKGVVAVLATEPDVEARIRAAVVQEWIKRVGGPLSEAEQKLVDEEPTDVPETLLDAMRAALEDIRSPKPVETVVHTANEEEEAE